MKLLLIGKYIFTFCLSILLFFNPFQIRSSESNTIYPTNGWQVSSPEEQGMQSKTLLKMMEAIRDKKYDIHSVTIVRNGELILDAYLYPFKYGEKHELHSVTKSVISALIGIAIDKGFINDVHQPIVHFFPDKNISHLDDLKRSMTLKDLLIMASGLDCKDGSANEWETTLEMRKAEDWTQYALSLPMAHRPGEYHQYCNAVSSEPLPPSSDDKARQDDMLARITRAPEQGIVWLTKDEGLALNGMFKRSASPSFRFENPLGCVKTPVLVPDQIMRMKKFGSNITIISNGKLTLKDGTRA